MYQNQLQVILAMQDDDFQIILQEDQILNKLQSQKYNYEDEYRELICLFSGKFKINEIEINTFTLGLWCFLYSIKNAFAVSEQATKTDIDVVLYLLHNDYEGLTENLFEDAKDFCLKHEISYDFAEEKILELIALSFRPLKMIPSRQSTGDKSHFNLDWLTGILSIVCRMTNCTREFALYKMSMVQAFYYVIQYLKEKDIKGEIKRRNSDEINAEIYKRTMDLGAMYYKSKYKD